MDQRKLCPTCNQRPVAVNYIKDGVRHYRKLCDVCMRTGKKERIARPNWVLSGYKKKTVCDRCGFKSKFPEQLGVFYVDGNLKNNNWTNLRTVCLNCQQEVYKSRLTWKAGPIVPDF
jgi:formate dehydrogenase maturation protein FdhE